VPPNDQSDLERKLLRYLVDHPDARDTLEGIAKWWLLEQEIREEKTKVQEALAELVAKGLVVEERMEDGRRVFGMNSEQRQRIIQLLKDK
jgi:predicted transcriptional regulator